MTGAELYPKEEINIKKAFFLARGISYTRASSRDSEMIIIEWWGAYSGKHCLLQHKINLQTGLQSTMASPLGSERTL